MIIPIVFCTDDNYVLPTMVSMQSIKLNNKKNKVDVYIFHNGLLQENKEKFKSLESDNFKVDFKDVTSYLNDNLYATSKYPTSIYYRFFIPQILSDLDKVIYLDCDIIVNKDLKNLVETSLTNCVIGAAKDCDVYLGTRNDDYVNSGVIIYNIQECIDFDFTKKCINYIAENQNLTCPDQDAINAVCKGKVAYIPIIYNFHTIFSYDYKKVKISKSKGLNLFGVKKQSDVTIYHYAGTNIKPWELIESPYAKLWWKVAKSLNVKVQREIIEFGRVKRKKLYDRYKNSGTYNQLISYSQKSKMQRFKLRVKQFLGKGC